ncbi:glycosyl hydrolase family 39 [Pelomyxa schiedti]|nr:glycosyl hydrolase family 39 [Pelomyxa schiedti]
MDTRRLVVLVVGVYFGLSTYVEAVGLSAYVVVDWLKVETEGYTIPTLQVVVNPELTRTGSIHNQSFEALESLPAQFVRFVPWLPYPKLAVAELEPPNGNPICATAEEGISIYLECPTSGAIISKVDFASYGTGSGVCGNFSQGSCQSTDALSIVSANCLNKAICSFTADDSTFGSVCAGMQKRLDVQVSCTPSSQTTNWDFSLIDPLMEDFMAATEDRSVVINFSTTPQWMWDTLSPVDYPDDPNEVTWSYEQGTELRDSSMTELSSYYSRLLQWYTQGGFEDEYGVWHESGHYYNIPAWEILNEVDAEHSNTPEYYTQIYDSIAGAMLAVKPDLQLVGMALAYHNEFDWYNYFLDHNNHESGIPLDYISYHFYASCGIRDDVMQYRTFFDQADDFFTEVQTIQQIRSSLSPGTKTAINEVGVILPNDNDKFTLPIPDIYWNAAGGLYAYIFSNLGKQGIEYVGESQLVGYPTQFPSVSMMNWDTGEPNARYWVLSMLLSYFPSKTGSNYKLTGTTCTNKEVYAQGYILPDKSRVILLVIKTDQDYEITINGATSCTLEYVDESTGDSPPAKIQLTSDTFTLKAFTVAILTQC